jgi:hypothetical protein
MIAERIGKREEEAINMAARLGYYDLLYWGEAVCPDKRHKQGTKSPPATW